ncbi:M15 family metallopeptidase [Candidatus Williamhamiltonella defendens]|nr:M15 family metallopeptidase [Candidatus Hamiltonella defensa]
MVENVIDVFAGYGFIIWGGDWNTQLLLTINTLK